MLYGSKRVRQSKRRKQPTVGSATELGAMLNRGLQQLSIELDEERQRKMLHYVELMLKWNQVYNLTSLRSADQVISRHILDSLTVIPYIKPDTILDIGSGAGLPGIPLALVKPDWSLVLLDSNAKKTRFLTQTVAELGLQNVEVVHTRLEEYAHEGGFDTVIARAFSSVENLLSHAGHLIRSDGRMLAMKGVYPLAELEGLPKGYVVKEVPRLHVPMVDAERHLVWVERSD